MKTKLLLTLALALSLSACATLPANDARRATDLELVRQGVIALSKDHEPTGPVKRLEDAETFGQAYDYAGDLEDVKALLHGDNARVIEFVTNAFATIERARVAACPWYAWRCKRAAASTPLQQAADETKKAP